MENSTLGPAKPFMKWLGGKSRMVKHLAPHIPEKCCTYFEPFLGGGSVLLHMANSRKFERAIVSDTNYDVINCWSVIKDGVDDLVSELESGKYEYEKKTFLRIRATVPDNMQPVERAARFIYLNKTCFNGIWRVNKSGGFNVPFGRYKNPQILNKENLQAVSSVVQNVDFRCSNFSSSLYESEKGDFIYFDPPYIPISKTSNFDSYTADGFGLDKHSDLATLFDVLTNSGIYCLASNSSSEITRDLYKDHEIIEVMGTRSVAGPGDWRNPVKELIIVGKKND